MVKRVSFIVIAVVTLCSCGAPKLVSTVSKTYPATVTADSVRLYDYGSPVPSSAEVLGSVAVLEKGFSKSYTLSQSTQFARKITAEVGGNAFLVTNFIFPNPRSTMFQVMGDILFLQDTVIFPYSPVTQTIAQIRKENTYRRLFSDPKAFKKIVWPKNRFSVIMGYCGWINGSFTFPDGTARRPDDGGIIGLSYDRYVPWLFYYGMDFYFHSRSYDYEGLKYGYSMMDFFPKISLSSLQLAGLSAFIKCFGGYSIYYEERYAEKSGGGQTDRKTLNRRDGWGAGVGIDLTYNIHEQMQVFLGCSTIYNRFKNNGTASDIWRGTVTLGITTLF